MGELHGVDDNYLYKYIVIIQFIRYLFEYYAMHSVEIWITRRLLQMAWSYEYTT